MTQRLFLLPTPGLRVVDPVTRKPLPPEGTWVEYSTHWLRRLREGDVAEATPPPAGAPEPAPEPASKAARAK